MNPLPRLAKLVFFALCTALLGALLFGCSQDLGADGVQFYCDDDDDCTAGYTCQERPDGLFVCADDGANDTNDKNDRNDNNNDNDKNDNPCGCDAQENQEFQCVDDNCEYSCMEGFKSCHADQNGCETSIETLDDCGDCGVSCEFDTDVPNATATCDDGDCIAECDDGWVNLDGQFETGCECNATDEIEALPKCDAVFVDPQGSNGNSGTSPNAPKRTFDSGIETALAQEKSYLMLATTDDEESYSSSIIIDGPISIVGGLAPENGWRRADDDARSTIVDGGIEEGADALMATTLWIDAGDGDDFDVSTTLAHLDIEPPATPESAGASITTVLVDGVEDYELAIVDTTIEIGEGADGADGDLNAGQPGQPGVGGEPGEDADGQTISSSGGVKQGGDGAVSDCTGVASGDGGDGGDADYPANALGASGDDGEQGADVSSNIKGGEGGAGGASDSDDGGGGSNTEAGEDGESGDDGSSATGASYVFLDDPPEQGDLVGILDSDGQWTTVDASAANTGQPGAGGGGGGAAGSLWLNNEQRDGGTGGGGGSGGCGGDGGEPGSDGGPAFGLVVIGAKITFDDLSVLGGQGGLGGDGAPGRCGGEGGAGGPGGAGDSQLKSGGDGGDGGHGGNGGGGAGGHGGPVIAVALVGGADYEELDSSSIDFDTGNAFGGEGGSGGSIEDGCPVTTSYQGVGGIDGVVEEVIDFGADDADGS